MSALVFLVLLSSCAVMRAQQQQEGRCDITQDVVTYTSCSLCFLNTANSCPLGTTQTTTGQGISDCVVFLFISGCRHRCVSTRVVEERCCEDYWGTHCDPCPGLNDAGSVCSGNGRCSSGIIGDGTCYCQDAFNGTNCELCSDEYTYGLDCNSTCTCKFGECNNTVFGDGHCQLDTCDNEFIGEDCDVELNSTGCTLGNHDCGNNSYCVEYLNATLSCLCIADYHPNPDGGNDCIEIDRCDLGTDNCHDNATCYYTSPNHFNCTCNDGFTGDGVYCQAIDPCQTNNGDCEENTTCVFTGPGLSSCECLEGFENYQPSVGCSLVNPCQDGSAGCSALANCTLIGPGSALCTCRSGYTGNGTVCYGSLLEELRSLNDSGRYKLSTFLSLTYDYGLDRLFDRGGVFTIFAPTDEAFDISVPFFDDEVTLLTHIIPTQINVTGLSTTTSFATMAGHVVEISSSNYTVVDGDESPAIVQSNLIATNGFINILDLVALIPEEARPTIPDPLMLTAFQLAFIWDRLSSFYNMIEQANLIDVFQFSPDVTMLAPTNEAIAALPPGTVSYLTSSHGIDDLILIANNHLVNGEASIVDIVAEQSLLTAQDTRYTVAFGTNGSISLGGANLILNNIRVRNGIVHVIDAVLKPPELDPIVNRFCPTFNITTTTTSCASCFALPSCPTGFTSTRVFLCGFFFNCGRTCIRNVTVSQCCDGFYGTDCLPCQENHVSPCSGNGQCFDGINGNGTCTCNDSFSGSICEFCSEPNMFGSNCSQECTCINGVCDSGPFGSGQCLPKSCNTGFTGDNCDVGVPHCGFLNDTCHIFATCQVVNGSEECTCRYGYNGDGITSCVAINRCLDPDRAGCHEEATCRYDGPGGATCICNSGWSGDGTSCSPIDPCALPSRGSCDTNAICMFTAPGENSCRCNFGYRGDGTSCTAINSCTINRGGCHLQATCISTGPGINNCTCNDPYIGDGYNCIGSLLDEISNVPKASMFYQLLQRSLLQPLFSLDSGNNYTVFVPSNTAIANATQEQLELWTTQHNLPLLIQHHVSSAIFSYGQLRNHTGSIPTILNDDVVVVTVAKRENSSNDTVFINNAGIDEYNYLALNGIFHIIDKVLFPDDSYLPSNLPPLVDVLRNRTEFTSVVSLIEMFNLTDTLNSGTYTVFAPTDEAFAELTDEEIANVTANITLFHVYPGSLPVESIYSGLQLLPLLPNSGPLTFTIEDSTIFVNDIPLNGTDFHAANSSVILPLNGVLEPIYSRCDIRNVTRVYGECGGCANTAARPCQQGSVVVVDQSCTYRVRILFFFITLRGCRQVCDDIDVTPRCCDGYYGPDCDACPQYKGDTCSARGSCNDTISGNGQCSCGGNYGGTACETCMDNMFGMDCGQTCNCSNNGVCNDGVDGDGSCSCLPGWQGDNCDTLVNSTVCGASCHPYAYCDTTQSVCVCADGYTGNGTYCSVIDVCADNGGCAPEAVCTPDPTSPGGRTCTCQPGMYSGDGIVCIPLDVCTLAANGGCDPNARCVMTGPGQRGCICNNGYTGDGVQSCDPINACDQTANGGCGANARCIPTGPAQRKCVCNENFAGDGYTCTATLRQLIATHPSLTTLDSYLNRMNSYGLRIGRFLTDVGPFTGFAISDAAYQEMMNNADNATLARYSNPDVLEKLVQFSFVGCTLRSADNLTRTSTLTTLMGSIITVSTSGNPAQIMVNNVILLTVDLVAHNGILHILNASVTPPTEDLIVGNTTVDLVNVLQSNGFSTLAGGIQVAGGDLISLLSNPSLIPFTIFAPNEAALSPFLIAQLLAPGNRALLESYVTYHMISGARLSPNDISKLTHLVTLQGGIIRLNCSDLGNLFVNDDNRVGLREVAFNGGVIYGINGVLVPPGEGADCDRATTLAAWTNCSASCNLNCPDGYSPVVNSTSQQDCDLPGGITGCRQLCTASSFERRCCSDYYSSSCLACPTTTAGVCSGVVDCDDGINGAGCVCPAPYAGQACEDCIAGYNRNGSVCVLVSITPTPTTIIASSTITTILVTTSSVTTTTTSAAVTASPSSSSVMVTISSMSTSGMTTTQSILSPTVTTSSTVTSQSTMTTSSAFTSGMTTSPSSMTTSLSSIITSSSSMTTSSSSIILSLSSMTTSSSSMKPSSSSMTSSSTMTSNLPSTITKSSMVTSQSTASRTMSSPTSTSQPTPTFSGDVKPPGASTGGGGSNAGVAVGVTLALIVLIIIVVIVIVLALYFYNKRRGFLKIGGWVSNKKDNDNVMLIMDPPASPVSYDNPLYSGPGDYMSNPLYDGIDDEV